CRDRLSHHGVSSQPEACQFVQGRLFLANPEHHLFSNLLRCSNTCSVVYHLPDCSRRSSSSSLIGGSHGSYWERSGSGVTWASVRPDSSHSSSGSVRLCSLLFKAESRTTFVIFNILSAQDIPASFSGFHSSSQSVRLQSIR